MIRFIWPREIGQYELVEHSQEHGYYVKQGWTADVYVDEDGTEIHDFLIDGQEAPYFIIQLDAGFELPWSMAGCFHGRALSPEIAVRETARAIARHRARA